MMMRTAFLLCLLCMGQAAAAPFAEESAIRGSGSASVSASMSPSPTGGAPSDSPTPIPDDSSSGDEDENKGLKEGENSLLGITVFLIFLIVLGMAYHYKYPKQEEGEETPGGWRGFMASLSVWHCCFFDLMLICIPKKGMRGICYVSVALPFLLGGVGMGIASGTLLGVAVLFLFIFAALVSDPVRYKDLDFPHSLSEVFAFCIACTVLVLSMVAPGLRLGGDNSQEGNAGLVLLMFLGYFLGAKALYGMISDKSAAYTVID